MPVQALPYIIMLGIFWGSSLVASRFSVDQFAPSTYIGIRLAIAGACHVLVYLLSKSRSFPRDARLWRHAALLGIFGTAIPMTAIVSSLQYQSSGLTSLLVTLNPAMTVVFAHFLLPDEPLNRLKALGVSLALAGAVLLAARGESGLPDVTQANPIGYGLVLVAIICGSAMTIYARRYMRDLDSFDVSSIRMWTATVAVLGLSSLTIGVDLSRVNAQGYAVLAYAALIGTFAALLLAFYNVKRFGATTSAITSWIVPIVAGIGGVLVLDETFTTGMLTGMTFIIAGIIILNLPHASPKVEPTTVHH